ncbi:hypothetical protein QQF64_016930 [Cirrhinus molitorella]|uniref:Uncharacterized protein n=1 Tax=Cirrhinus molitorella TaxID=172907 RepID=A0ABR3LRJ1_9TELE
MFHHPFSAYVHPDLSPDRRARGGGVRRGRACFDTEPGFLPIKPQQLESQSMRGIGKQKKTGLRRDGKNRVEIGRVSECGGLMRKPLTQEFLVFSERICD